ncbi:MAG: DEAD/DEAH box helicase [Moorea sp. SIO3I6]|nr:DEAD/DEAH box helicase [Moorena sp. SIO3I6]
MEKPCVNIATSSVDLDPNNLFPFELDEFQKQAIEALNHSQSVVVCAPTGSGKTLIGEYTIYRALSQGGRVFYTTPLKALSNQKLRDFRAKFGADKVGLVTGDSSVNREASVLVMTTEIFRNMLYGTPIGQVGASMLGVEAVILDECHYMNDRQRGTVWEESIIYCPPDIQIVALSATVANSDQLTDWLNQVHGSTQLIYSDFRPVPLEFYFAHPKGIVSLLNDDHTKINNSLKTRRPKSKDKHGRPEGPSISTVVSKLKKREMLPAIYFIFSRRGCDKAVDEMGPLSLVNEQEAAQLKKRIDEFISKNPEAARTKQIDPLYRGIAAHHAGILPAWKGLVEELFQQGLVKVVFATETLAAGINMPARTTVISSLSKRTDRGHRLLTASEFLQMAGRAGRRGMDTNGYVVTVQTPFEGAKEAAYLATAGADPLVSQFTPTYGMVLNLLQTHSLPQAKELVERSFAQYLATLYLKPQQQAITELTAELTRIDFQLAPVDVAVMEGYQKLKEHLKVERRILKDLQHQAEVSVSKAVSQLLQQVQPGVILYLKGKNVPVSSPVPAVLVSKQKGSGQFPYLVCLSAANRWYVATTADVMGLDGFPEVADDQVSNGSTEDYSTGSTQGESSDIINLRCLDIGTLQPLEGLEIKPGQVKSGNEDTEALANQVPTIAQLWVAPEVREQEGVVADLEGQMETHALRQWGNPSQLIKRHKKRLFLQEQINQRQAKFREYQAQHWHEFLNLIEILKASGSLEDLTPTVLGQAAASLRGENELWLALAMLSGELDDLDPHQLAAACSALVTETPRPDSWTNYQPSEEVLEALANLRRIRRQVFQLQRRYHVALPVWSEDRLIGLVEQWSLGKSWREICGNSSLDEGDVVRILRRTLDILSQIPHVLPLSESLKANAIRAAQLLDRFPVNERVK